MQANDLLEYRDKIIEAFKDGTFLTKHLKKTDDAAYDYVLNDVNNFIQKIKSMEEKIILSLFEDFFEFSSPADYAKKFINTSPDKNKEFVEEIEDRISNLKDEIKKMSETEKNNKYPDETLKIIKKILDYNKDAQKIFQHAPKVNKRKSEPEGNIAERTILIKEMVAEIEKEEKNIDYELFNRYFTNYQSPSDMYKKLCKTEGKENDEQVYSIKKVLNKMKKNIEGVPKNKKIMIDENKNIINIVDNILTPNQMLSRLSISLAQINAGNNSEKLKKEMRQLLHSLYRSKKLTKQLYKSLSDTI